MVVLVVVHAVQANCGDFGFGFGARKQTVVVVALVLVLVHVSKLWWWWLWFWLWCTYAQPAAGERHEFGGRSASHRSGGHSGFLIRGGSLYSHPRQQANLSITKPRAIMCI